MKYRNQFLKFQAQQGEAGGEAPAIPAPAPAPAPAIPAPAIPAIPAIPAPTPPAQPDPDYAEFMAWKKSKADASTFDKMKQSETERSKTEKQSADQEAQIREEIGFDAGFDKLINDNKNLFAQSAEVIRESAKGLVGADKMHTMKCLTVQSFFASTANVELLTPADAEYIKTLVIGAHERNIDASRAFKVLDGALNVAKRLNLADNYAGNKAGGTSSTPALDAFIQKAKDRMTGKKTAVK